MELRLQVCNLICGLIMLQSISPLKCLKTTTHKETNIVSISEFSAISRKMSQRSHTSNRKENSSSRRKRWTSIDDIECNQNSLEAILENCENAAAASIQTLASAPSRSKRNTGSASFCGSSCSNLVFTYVNVCGLQEFLVNVSGACKLDGNNFTVHCIHAVVVVKPGIVSCTKTLQASDSHDIRHLVDASKSYTESQCCSLQTHYNSSLPGHDIIFDRTIQKFRIEPPLVPPWQIMSNYSPLLDVTRSDLCVQQVTTETSTTASTELVNRTGELVSTNPYDIVSHSGTCQTSFRQGFAFHWCVLFYCFCFALLLSSQTTT